MRREKIDWSLYAKEWHSQQQASFKLAKSIVSRHREWHRALQARFKLHPAVEEAFKKYTVASWQQMLLEWPHKAETDLTRLAYTRDERAGKDDRQTITTLGKYLTRHFEGIPDHVVRDLVAKHATQAQFVIENTASAIVNAVQNGPSSCMAFTEKSMEELDYRHPYEAYAPEYGWHIVTRRMGSAIVGRALLMQRDCDALSRKYFVRTYRSNPGETYSQPDHELIQWLQDQGYECRRSWKGERLAYVKHPDCHAESEFLVPYIDGECQNVDLMYDSHMKKQALHITDVGEWRCTNTDGSAEQAETHTCDDCGSRCAENDGHSVGEHDDRTVGPCCIDDYSHVTGRRGHTYNVPTCEAVEVNGNYYHTEYLTDNDIVELHNGDYAHTDETVYIAYRSEYYDHDDSDIVCDYNSEQQHIDDCVELHNGDYALEDETWECAGSGNHYLTAEDEPVEIDGETYHSDHTPEQDEDEDEDAAAPLAQATPTTATN